MAASQTYANHARIVPAYHYVIVPALTVNLGWQLYQLGRVRSFDAVVDALVAVALVLMAIYMRTFALTVQDRVIRLEMRLRLREVLPQELRARIPELSLNQLIGLRFASDQELPELVTTVLDDRIEDRRTVKQLVSDWQADDLRV